MKAVFKTKKITFVLLVSALVIAVIAGGAIIAYNTRQQQLLRFDDQAAKQQAILADSVGQSITTEIIGDLNYLDLAAEVADAKSADITTCGAKLEELTNEATAHFARIDRLSPAGNISCSSNRALIGKSGSGQGYSNDIFNDSSHKSVLSHGVRVDGIPGMVAFLETPIVGPKGEFLGVVSGLISMRDIQTRHLDKAKLTSRSTVSLIDDNRDLLVLGNQANEGKNYSDQVIKDAVGADYSKFSVQVDQAIAGHASIVYFVAAKQARVVALQPVKMLPGRTWVVSVGQTLADIAITNNDAANLALIIKAILAFALLVALSGAAIIIYIIRSVLDPIKKVTLAAAEIGEGNFDQRLSYRGEDEIGRLAGSFNVIADQLRQYYVQLQQAVDQKSTELNTKLADIERNNQILEDTKRAIMNILDDLSEEKATVDTEKLKDEALIDSIGEGLIFTNEYGNIVSINPIAQELLGCKAEEVLDQWFPKAVVAVDAKGKIIDPQNRMITNALLTGKIVTGDSIYKRKDDTTFPAFVTVSPVLVEGRPVGAVEVFRDVTKERELDKAKEDFVSLASHQLRTPATGVKAFTSMLLDGYAGKLTAKQEEFLNKAIDSNERQLRIIDDMLNVARADSGRMVLVRTDFDLSSLVDDIVTEQKPTIEERHQTIELSRPKDKIMLNADPAKIRMAIENLVSNASKYTPENGKVEVTVEKGAKAIVVVKDNGVGIAKADMSKLFQKFSRLDNKLSALVGGTGLGLYLVKKIIELHKGKIKTESVIGKGTSFTVELPMKG